MRVREINANHLQKFEVDDMDATTYDNELDLIVQDSGIFKDIRLKRREFVNIASQTLDEREFRTHSLSERIETIIESNTRSIVGVISSNQLDNYYKMFKQKSAIPTRAMNPVISEVDFMAGSGSYKGIPQFN